MRSEGFEKSIELLHRAMTPEGFVASIVDKSNYRRIWTRDGVITSLAVLMTEDERLFLGAERTLKTIADHQGPHGEIPSNVASDGSVSYGGLVGRVDSSLWYIIGVCVFVKRTGRKDIAEYHRRRMEKVLFLAACWEFNNKGLIYAPLSSDWADEFIIFGFTLFAQTLYYLALKNFGELFEDEVYIQKAGSLKNLIEGNYWIRDNIHKEDLYHKNAYCQLLEKGIPGQFWLASFSPSGYNTMFDGFGNSLALLSKLGSVDTDQAVIDFVAKSSNESGSNLIHAFYPPIEPADNNWKLLQQNYRYKFSNNPWEYHNGGIWPMIAGFWTAALVRCGDIESASICSKAIESANYQNINEEEWGFFEWHHGRTGEPGGLRYMAWSAAGTVMAELAVKEKLLPF